MVIGGEGGGIIWGTTLGAINGDTRSLDYGSNENSNIVIMIRYKTSDIVRTVAI